VDQSDPNPADFDGLFGLDGWTELVKFETTEGQAENNSEDGFSFSWTSNFMGGTWDLAGLIGDFVIVLKDGNKAPAPTIFYLVEGGSSESGPRHGSTMERPTAR
jgi:hypothetical protein